jgi:sugar lactone lactonase YvrE
MPSTAMEPRVLVDGLAYVESPRWHDGRLWFCHWGAGEILAVDLDGNTEVIGAAPPKINAARPGHGLGWAIDWLPDGRLLLTGKELLRREPDGSMVPHADLAALADFWNEIVVDGRGNVYVNSIAFQFIAGAKPNSGIIALVTPDGTARQVAGELALPNGMVVTPDNKTLIVAESMAGRLTAFDISADGSLSNRRIWADDLGPDGICSDQQGTIWAQTPDHPQGSIVRVREGGERLQRIDHDRTIFASMLGGPSGQTLFLASAEWRGLEHLDEALAARTGQILMTNAPAPRAGWP